MKNVAHGLWLNENTISTIECENRDDNKNQYIITFTNGNIINLSHNKNCGYDRKLSALLESVSFSLQDIKHALELYSNLQQGEINSLMKSIEKMAAS